MNYFFSTGRQPVVSIMSEVLEQVTDRWDKKDTEINTKMETLIQLQRDRLEMECLNLEFQCELAGLKSKPKGTLMVALL